MQPLLTSQRNSVTDKIIKAYSINFGRSMHRSTTYVSPEIAHQVATSATVLAGATAKSAVVGYAPAPVKKVIVLGVGAAVVVAAGAQAIQRTGPAYSPTALGPFLNPKGAAIALKQVTSPTRPVSALQTAPSVESEVRPPSPGFQFGSPLEDFGSSSFLDFLSDGFQNPELIMQLLVPTLGWIAGLGLIGWGSYHLAIIIFNTYIAPHFQRVDQLPRRLKWAGLIALLWYFWIFIGVYLLYDPYNTVFSFLAQMANSMDTPMLSSEFIFDDIYLNRRMWGHMAAEYLGSTLYFSNEIVPSQYSTDYERATNYLTFHIVQQALGIFKGFLSPWEMQRYHGYLTWMYAFDWITTILGVPPLKVSDHLQLDGVPVTSYLIKNMALQSAIDQILRTHSGIYDYDNLVVPCGKIEETYISEWMVYVDNFTKEFKLSTCMI